MSAVRLRRLKADYERLKEYVRRQPRVELLQTDGDPPERYQLNFRVKGLRKKGDEIQPATGHLVEISLPRDYPRLPPQCRMLTPVFHPNIAPHAICIGDHWSAGQTLTTIVARIGEMLAFQAYNTKSPLNGEAARWTDQNIERLPLDDAVFVVDESSFAAPNATVAAAPATSASAAAAPAAHPRATPPEDDSAGYRLAGDASKPPAPASPPPAPEAADVIVVSCGNCSAKLRVPAAQGGKLIRCPRCREVMRVPGQV